jgi:hypothetical protein
MLIATLRYSNVQDEQTGSLNSLNQFFLSGVLDSTLVTDQVKTGSGHSQTYGGKITYNEPITAKWNLVTEYSYNGNNSTARRNTFERDPNGKYTVLNPLYSNNFDLNAYANTGIVTMRYMGKKLKSAFGGGISAVQLGVNNLDQGEHHVYNFTNFTPQVQFSYALKTQTNIGFRYNGQTRQPTIDQLQPIRNNNDPLNVFIGNPNLKVGFNHNFNLWYNSFQILKGRYMYIGLGFNLEQNQIANYSIVDSFGKATNTPINVHGSNNYYLYGGWMSGQGDKKLIWELNTNTNGGRNVTFINGRESINNYANIEWSIAARYSIQEKYNFRVGPKIGRNISQSSLRKDVNNSYWVYGGHAEGWVQLPWKLEVSSDADFDLRQHIPALAGNLNIILWNAELARKIFKDKTGKIIFRANDILNQNKGYNRIINSNFVTDQRYQKVGQYFMLTFQWTFTKMPGQK